MQVDYR